MGDTKRSIIRSAVYDVLAAITLRATSNIHDEDDLIADLAIDSDDLSMWMIPELERRLGHTTSQRDWDHVATVQDVIDVFESRR